MTAVARLPSGTVCLEEAGVRVLRFDPLGNFLGLADTCSTPLSGGPLRIAPSPGTALTEGAEFPLMHVGAGLTDTFDTVTLPELAGELTWDTSSLYSHGLLRIVAQGP